MVKIETKLKGVKWLQKTIWPEIKPNDEVIQGEEKIAEAWYFESKAKNGKWPDERIGGQREPEWKICIDKDHSCLNGIKIEYSYIVVLKDDGWNYEEKDCDYIYEIEFDENAGIVDEKNKNERHFWKDDPIIKFMKNKNDEDKSSKDKTEREREREQNWGITETNCWIRDYN